MTGAPPNGTVRPPRTVSHRYVALGGADTWIAYDVVTHDAIPIRLPKDFHPSDLTVSEDGSTAVCVAENPRAPNQARLYAWSLRASTTPTEIGEPRGYYADPRISSDGAWVYVAHNAVGRGSPFGHNHQAYAQIYRLHPDGTGLEPLTDEDGCHVAPTVTGPNRIVYVHGACVSPERDIETLDLGKKQRKRLLATSKSINELRLSSGGRFAIISVTGNETVALERADLKTGKVQRLVQFRRESEKVRPEFGATEDEILFARGRGVWSLKNGQAQQILSFSEVFR